MSAPCPRAHRSRLRRVLAAPLAIWMLVALVLAGRHVADGTHARRADGALLHVGAWVDGLRHAACDHDSRTPTVDRDSRPADDTDVCRLDRGVRATVTTAAAPPLASLPPLPGTVPLATPRAATTATVLIVAPKTSPPA